MTRDTGIKILKLQEKVWEDPEFQELSKEH